MGITKLQVAEREIIAAVKLFFDGGDPVPVYVLAAAAREITTTLYEKRGVRSILADIQEAHPNLSIKQLYKIVSKHAAFFKHADRDPDGVLVDFTEQEAETALYVAVHEFGRLCGGMPVEAQAFEGWYLALHLPSDVLPRLLERLPKRTVRQSRRGLSRRLKSG